MGALRVILTVRRILLAYPNSKCIISSVYTEVIEG
jgi:hypothetical protein